MKDSTHLPESIDQAKFKVVRKGYDKREVRQYLEDLETAFRDLETWSRKAKVQLAEAEGRLNASQAEADGSVDNAMFAVFDAKDRILEKARRRAEQIEEEARAEANEIKARAARLSGDEGADEILAAAREEAQDIIDRAKREALKLGAGDVETMRREMEQKDEQLSSMRQQLVASKSDEPVEGSEIVAAAQQRANEIVRAAEQRAATIEAGAAAGNSGEAAGILESARARAAEIETRAERLLADAEQRLAAAAAAEAAAAQQSMSPAPAGFGDISDDALLAGMASELREVHDQVEERRRELAEIDQEVEARRLELREAFDAAEAQKAEARQAAEQLAAIQDDLAGAAATSTTEDAAAEREQILAAAREEAGQLAIGITRDAEERKQALEAEIADLRDSLEAMQAAGVEAGGTDPGRLAQLEEEIEELRASKNKARQQSAVYAELVDELKAQVSDLTSQLAAGEAEPGAGGGSGDDAELRERITALQLQLDSKDAEFAATTKDLREEADALAARVSELSNELEAKAAEVAGQTGPVDEQVTQLQSHIAELSALLAAKDQEIETASLGSRQEGEELARRVAELSAELEAKDREFEVAVGESRAEAESLAGRVAELSAELEAKTTEAEAQSQTAVEQIAGLESEVAELTGRLEAKQSEFDAVAADSREEAAALAGRVSELSDQLEAKVAEAASQRAEAAEIIGGLEVQVADLSRELEAKDAEVAARVQPMEERIASLQTELADARARLDAKNAEFDETTAQLREESDALAGRVAELSSEAEVVAAQLATAEAKAARIDPLSNELTKAQVALAAQRGDMEKLVGLADISRQLRERVADLEQELHEARVDAVEMAKLRTQVAGLKARADKAEQAAAFADEQLAQIITDVENAESEAIRRAAAAEAARIRELTEDSLGIARGHTAGTGLDADDYTGVAVTAAEFTADPDDWSDIFAAADAAAARLAGQPEVTEGDIAAFVAEVAAPEAVETQPVTASETTEDEGGGEQGPSTPVNESIDADTEADQDLDVPAGEAAGDVDDTWVLGAGVEVLESAGEGPAAESTAADGEDEPQLPDYVAMIEEATPFAAVDDLVNEPDDVIEDDAAGADEVVEVIAHEAHVAVAPDEEPAGAVDEAPRDVISDSATVVDQADEDETSGPPTGGVLDEVVEVVNAPPVTAVMAADPVDEDVENQGEDSVPADFAERTVEVADAEPVDAVVEEPADEVSDRHPVDAPAAEDEPAPVTELSGDDLEAAWAEFESAGPGDAGGADITVTDVAEESVAADEMIPADMAERLRLARAELEAELDPATLPPEQLAPPAAADDLGFPEDGVITRRPTETRYARQSAKLPRIADSEESEADGVSSMSRFRARMLRGKKDDD